MDRSTTSMSREGEGRGGRSKDYLSQEETIQKGRHIFLDFG